MSLSTSCLYYGKNQPPAEVIPLKAGRITLFFEPETAFLRRIRVGDFEIIRAIYGAVRDENWNTIPPAVSNVRFHEKDDGFELSFEAVCREGSVDFAWKGLIEASGEGMVSFEFQGLARSTFKRNRIGLCVLHPIWECAGKPCRVTHVDGTQSKGEFPKYISPHQPFKNIQSIAHEAAPGVRAEIAFEGEIFEMEDQRNWTDASYKTYGTPLDLPFPVEMAKGGEIRQKATLTLSGEHQKILPVLLGRPPQISIATTPVLAKPRLGLGLASHGKPLTARQAERIKRLEMNHLRVELELGGAGVDSKLNRALEEANSIGAGLHVVLILSDNAESELAGFKEALKDRAIPVSLWQVFHVQEKATREKWIRLAANALASVKPGALFAGGTYAYFAELNRDRPPSDSMALPAYSINPQVHASDIVSMAENLGAQSMTAESVSQFHPKSAVISPITLKPRFNPNATSGEAPGGEGELPPEVDARQMSLFGAGWTLGSLAALGTASNIHHLTYYETTGWRGLMEEESGPPLPGRFPSISDGVYPAYFVFAWMAGYQRLYMTYSSHPLQCAALTLLNEKNKRRVLIANLTGDKLNVRVKSGTAQGAVVFLDENNAESAMKDPEAFLGEKGSEIGSAAGKIALDLKPFALAKLDIL